MNNNYKLVKNTEWQEVEINSENKGLPKNWKKVSVSELVLSKGDLKKGPFGSSITKNMFVNNGIKVYEQKNAIKKDFNLGNSYITKEKFKELSGFIVEPGDFIMSCAGTIGELYLLPPEAPTGVINQALIKMKICKEIIHYGYFKFLFSFDNFKKGFSSDGGIIVNFNLDTLRKVECILPILEKQIAIADILSSQESIIQDIESLISKYESRFQYLSEELLSGRLRVKEVEGQLKLYKNADNNWKEVEVNGEIKEIPKDFTLSEVQSIISFQKGKAPNKYNIKDTKIYPYLSMDLIRGKSGNEIIYSSKGVEVNKNDTLILWDGSNSGEIIKSPINGYLSSTMSLFKQRNNLLENDFLFYLFKFKEDIIRSESQGTGIPHVNGNWLNSFIVYFPIQSEQILVSIILFQQENLINQQKDILLKEKQKFDWLLDNLLSGKYLVKDF